MKKVFISILVLLSFIETRAQQGGVTFGNNSATPITAFGTNVHATVALYGSQLTGLSTDSSLIQIGAPVNTFAPGLFSGGTRNIGGPGDTVTLQVRAWTGGFATYELAVAAALGGNPSVLFGRHNIWEQPVGGGTLPTQPITGSGRFQGLEIGIPEPSSIALALFGAAALGLCLRRKQ